MKDFETFSLFAILLILLQLSNGQEICLEAGARCSKNCTQVLFCPSGTGEEPILIDTCFGEEECTMVTDGYYDCRVGGSCVVEPDLTPVVCGETGVIPDLFKCSDYYFCSRPNLAPDFACICSGSEIFNQESNRCQKPEGILCDPLSDVDCTKPGQCHAIPFDSDTNTTYYAYICVPADTGFVPEIYSCWGTFNQTTCTCTPPTLTNRTPTKLDRFHRLETHLKAATCSPYVPPEVTTSGPTTTIPPGETKPTCTFSEQKFPAVDCTKYWFCDSNLVPHYLSCSDGSHFDDVDLICILGDC